jgi:hypothetical protein
MRRCILFSFVLCLAVTLGEAFAAEEAKKPTLYVDSIERGDDEVFITYSYRTGSPPDSAEIFQVALAQCRHLGFHNAVRSPDPTLRKCTAIGPGAVCMRESATDNFCCKEPINPYAHGDSACTVAQSPASDKQSGSRP